MRWAFANESAYASGRLWGSGSGVGCVDGHWAVPVGAEPCLPRGTRVRGTKPGASPIVLASLIWGQRPAGARRGRGPGCSSEGSPGRGEGATWGLTGTQDVESVKMVLFLSRAPCTRLHHEFHNSRLLPKVTLLPSSQHIRAHGHFLILKPARLERTLSHSSRPQGPEDSVAPVGAGAPPRWVSQRQGRARLRCCRSRTGAWGRGQPSPAAPVVTSPAALLFPPSPHVPGCVAPSRAFAEARPWHGVSERYFRPVSRSGRLGVQSRHPPEAPGSAVGGQRAVGSRSPASWAAQGGLASCWT